MSRRIRLLVPVVALLAAPFLPLSTPASAATATLTGALPALGSAQRAFEPGVGSITAAVSCTGKARVKVTIRDPGGTSLTSGTVSCPRTATLTANAAVTGTFTISLQETRGYATSYTVGLTTAAGSTTTTTATPTTTTTVAPTTTTTVAPTTTTVAAPSLLWSAGMENGSTSEWAVNSGGGLYNSGTFEAVASADVAHTGSSSLRARIWTPSTSGVRAFRWAESHANRSLYYSAWIYLPTDFSLTADPNTGQFLNLMQFKSRTADGSRNDPLWGVYAVPNGAGGLYLRAGWGWGGTPVAGPYATSDVSGKWYEPSTRVTLPVGRWVHIEAFLHQSNGFDGAFTFWQDGTKVLDFTGIRTSFNNCSYNSWCAANDWSVNLYSDGLTPNPATMYIDDAAISRSYIP